MPGVVGGMSSLANAASTEWLSLAGITAELPAGTYPVQMRSQSAGAVASASNLEARVIAIPLG